MTIADLDDSMESLDEAELELLSDYLAGRLTNDEEVAFEQRLDHDSTFRSRMRPVLRDCYKTELLPMEIELGTRLAERGLIQAPRLASPLRRRHRRRLAWKTWERQ